MSRRRRGVPPPVTLVPAGMQAPEPALEVPPAPEPAPELDPALEQLLTSAEVAEQLRIAPRSLRRYARTGQLPCIKIGRSVRYRRSDLRKYLGI